jgi:hypothetical protein
MNPHMWIEIIAVVATALAVYLNQGKLPPPMK